MTRSAKYACFAGYLLTLVHTTGCQQRPEPAPPAVDVSKGQDDSRMRAASACLAQDDFACIVRTLEGNAQTHTELGLLIESYRALGDATNARRHMKHYVERFPSGRWADDYRGILAQERANWLQLTGPR